MTKTLLEFFCRLRYVRAHTHTYTDGYVCVCVYFCVTLVINVNDDHAILAQPSIDIGGRLLGREGGLTELCTVQNNEVQRQLQTMDWRLPFGASRLTLRA